nr:MetaGeneMark_Unknown Function [uncultured bacterium]
MWWAVTQNQVIPFPIRLAQAMFNERDDAIDLFRIRNRGVDDTGQRIMGPNEASRSPVCRA